MPLDIRSEVFENPVSVNISRNPIEMNLTNPDTNSDYNYKTNIPYGEIISMKGRATHEAKSPAGEGYPETHLFIDPTDIKLKKQQLQPFCF